jgi:hypothetical protein
LGGSGDGALMARKDEIMPDPDDHLAHAAVLHGIGVP